MKPLPLPTPERIAEMPAGQHRAGLIRLMYADRYSLADIEQATGASCEEIRRTLHRPVRKGGMCGQD